jgi:hypothetical protein
LRGTVGKDAKLIMQSVQVRGVHSVDLYVRHDEVAPGRYIYVRVRAADSSTSVGVPGQHGALASRWPQNRYRQGDIAAKELFRERMDMPVD